MAKSLDPVGHSDQQKIWSLRVAYKQYEVTRSVKLNKYPKHDANLLDRVRDIRQNHWTIKYRSL